MIGRNRGSRLLLAALVAVSTLLVSAPPALAATGSVSFATTSSSTAGESGGHAVTLVLDVDAPLAADVVVSVTDLGIGTAQPGVDYTFTSPTLVTFDAGSANGTTRQITVTLIDDSIDAANVTMTLGVAMSSAVGDTVTASGNHTVTIVDDDIGLSVTAPSDVTETDVGTLMTFTVTASSVPPAPLTVDASTAAPPIDPATAGVDYTAFADVQFTITPPATSVDVPVTILGDDLVEGSERVRLVIANPGAGGVIVVGQATGTIADDDQVPVANDDGYGLERGGSLTVSAANGVIRGLGTDTDEDSILSLVATLVSSPTHHVGTFVLNANGSFTYDHDGTLTSSDSFTYTVTDVGGSVSNVATVNFNITNNNLVPVLTPGPDVTGDEGSSIQITASFTDGNPGDSHVAGIDWGDGSESGATIDGSNITASHTYADDGVYDVTITLSDGLDTDVDGLTVTVANVVPRVELTGGKTDIPEGTAIQFVATPIDPGDELFNYRWQVLRNGVVFETVFDSSGDPSSTFFFTPPDDAENGSAIVWRVSARVSDRDGGVFTKSRRVTVTNVEPSATIVADGVPVAGAVNLGDEGQTVTFTADVIDPGSADGHSYRWEVLNRGVIAAGTGPSFAFTPPDDDTYIVRVDVDDDDSVDDTSGTDAIFASFDNVAPGLGEVRGNLSPGVGRTTFLRVFPTDAGSADTHTVGVDWGDGSADAADGSGIKLTHAFDSAGIYEAQICVTDDDLAVTCRSVVFNVGGSLSLGSDFDGDGNDDAAIGVPGEANGGGVAVFTSTAFGPAVAGNTLLVQGVGGMPDADESGDEFGTALAWGDMDGDGFDDLVVGHPGETVAGRAAAGAITVIPGSATGLDPTLAKRLHQDSSGVPGSVDEGDRFGEEVVTGDFNGDAFADVAVGVPGEAVGGDAGAGIVIVLYGSVSGITTVGSRGLHLDTPLVPGAARQQDALGSALAAGDFGGDGETDLAVGIPKRSVAGQKNAGAVAVFKGSVLGLIGEGSQLWTQKSAGVPDTPETGDRFGDALAAVDTDGDGSDELAVGAPNEGLAGEAKVGAVWVFPGTRTLLGKVGVTRWTEDSAGIPGTTSPGDRFGSSLAGADFDNDGFGDLAVGVPFETVAGKRNAGVVLVVRGSATGLTGAGTQRWHENSDGIAGKVGGGDRFGTSLATLRANADSRPDLLIGIPYQNTGGAADSGAVLFMRGGPGGLVAKGDRSLHQAITGVVDSPEPGDLFGLGL